MGGANQGGGEGVKGLYRGQPDREEEVEQQWNIIGGEVPMLHYSGPL